MNYSIGIDANLLVNALVSGPYAAQAIDLIDFFRHKNYRLVAPTLLAFEVTSSLRRLVYLKQISAEHGETAFQAFRRVAIRYSGRSDEVIQLAWHLSKSLDLPRAYDAAYLAVAQLSRCDFWTADKRLYNAVSPTLNWVHWIEETPTT